MTNLYVGFHKYKLQWKNMEIRILYLKIQRRHSNQYICGLFWILTFEISNDLYETSITE